jgi:PR domain zinc finger protein 5
LSEGSKKGRLPRKRGKKKPQKKVKAELVTKRLKRDIVFIEADNSEEDKPKKREKCKECGKVFSNKNSLRLHRKNAHFRAEDAPFKCHICGRGFKYSINLTSHMQIHKESYSCDECGRVFASKADVKKHALNQHKCSLSYECNKCRRLYCSVKRYQKHREQCSDYGSASKKKMQKVKEDFTFAGRDLFKTVAPTTTTYWSDSFSD